MTFSEGLDELRFLIGEPYPVRVLDARLCTLLDWGQQATNDALRYFWRTDSTSVVFVNGTGEYAPPTDCALPDWVRWASTPIRKSTTEEWENRGLDWRAKTGAPEEWAMYGALLVFQPIPDAAAVALAPSPVIRYVGRPDPYKTAPFSQLAPQHHWLPVLHAAATWFGLPMSALQGDSAKSTFGMWKDGVAAAAGFYEGRDIRL